MQFQIGDVVQLKSSGPLMTVTHIDDEDGVVTCIWFNRPEGGAFEPKSASFPPAALNKAR